MKNLSQAFVAALTLTCAYSFVAPPAVAAPATLLDLLRGKKSSPSRDAIAGSLDDDYGDFPEPARSKALPKVSSPQYFTYRVDPLKLINVSKFAPSLQTAANHTAEPTTTGSIETASLDSTIDAVTDPRAYMADVSVKAPAEVAAAIEKFYSSRDGLVWVDADGVTDKARKALATLASADMVGLDPADYKVVDPSDTFDSVDKATRQRQLMQFEIELSAATLTYVLDAQRGRINPNRISEYHDFKLRDVNLVGALTNIMLSPDVARYLESRSPLNPQFEALKREYARLKEESGGDEARITIAPGTFLKPGNSDPELANVVAAIRHHGSDTLKVDHALTLADYSGSSDYTPDLVALVKAFQSESGLKPDGIVGQGTIRALLGGDNSATKLNKLTIAMEQMRWLPRDLGARYVFINQPAFQAYYHEGGQEQFHMRVVVGSKAHQTFFFEDKIQLVEFNPYWGVPRSIIVNEMLPKLRNDPSYLDRLGYETSINGRQISSSSVNWHATDAVDVRQPPGSGNALGQLKILFPNSHAIYMHDTPQKSFFKRDMRALSHGCVRLVDPKKMAAAVLGTSVDKVDSYIASGQNQQVKVPEQFPVYVAYFTAYPDKDGKIEYYDDVYNRDMYMNRAFETTKKVRDVAS